MRYGGRVFGGAAHAPTFGRICDAFGPTYPGEASAGFYPLQYPGVCFLFPLGGGPTQQQQQAAALQAGGGLSGGAALPVSLSTPAARILVHHGAAASPAAAHAAPPPPLPRAAAYLERVEAVPGQGLLFASGGQLLRFGDSPQEVVAELGPPCSTHAKAGRPTGGGGGGAPAAGAAPAAGPDYFYSWVRGGAHWQDVCRAAASSSSEQQAAHTRPAHAGTHGCPHRLSLRLSIPLSPARHSPPSPTGGPWRGRLV